MDIQQKDCDAITVKLDKSGLWNNRMEPLEKQHLRKSRRHMDKIQSRDSNRVLSPGEIIKLKNYPGRYQVIYQFGESLSVRGIDPICPVFGVEIFGSTYEYDLSTYIDISEISEVVSFVKSSRCKDEIRGKSDTTYL